MSKRCPDCGFVNDDSRIYCGSCGELLDANLRLIKKLNEQTSNPQKSVTQTPPPRQEPAPAPTRTPDNDEPLSKLAREKKKSNAALWIVLGIALVVVGAIIVLLSL